MASSTSMNEDQRKTHIMSEVKQVLNRATGIPPSRIKDKDNLGEDLHMNNLQIRALAVPFTTIARQFNSDAVISPDECEECETVDDCSVLVFEKSKA